LIVLEVRSGPRQQAAVVIHGYDQEAWFYLIDGADSRPESSLRHFIQYELRPPALVRTVELLAALGV
jgi:hypothetical protein